MSVYCMVCGDEIPEVDRNGKRLAPKRRAARKACDKHECRGQILIKACRRPKQKAQIYYIQKTPMNRFILGYD